jgi:hypothetical protein
VEFRLAVRLGDFNRKDLEALQEGSEARERLPPAAADAHEKRIPPLHADDARDAARVLDGVPEQHQLPAGVGLRV